MERSLTELYNAATALNPAARKRFLDENCPDPAVRAEVERRLASETTKSIEAPSWLAPGSTLGHYVIQRSLGAGGMGVVFEAMDQKLHRKVAIKTLAPGAIDEESRRRFMREAQAASALNHPNIVTVYEVGQESGTDFIVMECIVGQTLRQAIGKKGLPLGAALSYAIQMADALAAAHEAGIVHRDFKPGNVMITERGLVKVLDFGLAKQNRLPGGDNTAEMSLTQEGHAVGTVFYMSPEQAQGKNVDARSDLFSFGSVLYEMLTGARAFHGESDIGTLAAVLERQPVPIGQLSPNVPPPLQRLISKCMEKKPHNRWQSMQDVKLLLEDVSKDLSAPPAKPKVSAVRPAWWIPTMALVSGVLLTVAVYPFFRSIEPAKPDPVYKMLTATNGLNDYPALSKDGRFLAFSSDRSGEDNLDIWLQQMGAREPIRLTKDAADESDPAFSPDGTRIAFRSEKDGGGIYVVPTLGGDPILLVPGGRNPRFSPDGRWIAYWAGRADAALSKGSTAVFIIDAAGGQPRAIHAEMGAAFYPAWSPGSDRLLVFGFKDSEEQYDYWALPVDGGEATKTGGYPSLQKQGLIGVVQLGAEWPFVWLGSPSSHVLFERTLGDSSNLWEADLTARGVFTSRARHITQGPGRQAHPAWASATDVDRVAFSDQVANYDVWSIPVDATRGRPTGEMTRLTSSISTEWTPSITSDGRKLLYLTSSSGEWVLVLKDLESGHARALITSQTLLSSARISGDGRRVVYRNKHFDLLTIATAGGAVEKLCDYCGHVTGISHDGNSILYEPVQNEDLLSFELKQRKTVKLALRPNKDSVLSGARFSPDEKWVAFHSVDGPAKNARVWIAPVNRENPAPRSDWIAVTEDGGFSQDPCWSSNGNVVYFTSERDGFRCFWGQPLDERTRKPVGEAFALRHFHSARQSLRGLALEGYLVGLSSGANRLVFSFPELTGNIWLQETAHAK